MSETIKTDGENYTSKLDNITEQLDWVNKQVTKELSDLQKEVKDNANIKKTFFNVDTEKKTVTYDMVLVKDYLQSWINKGEFQINSAVTMAVQIALESMGKDVGKIDGLLKNPKGTLSNTEKAIREFQKENGLRVDGVPGRNTVKKILENLGNISVKTENEPEKKEDKIESPKGNEDLDNTLKSLNFKQEDLIKLFALEIYRGRVMSDEEIAKDYDPKDVRKLVNDKHEMERLDRIIPKNIRHEQVTQFLEVHNPNKEIKGDSIAAEPKESEKEPVEKPMEKKEDNNQKESWKSVDILVGPKLKATSKKELGGIGSSIMHGFQGYDLRSFGFSNMAGKKNGKADNSRFEEENGKLYENFILPRAELIKYCENHNIKSFMFYFGGNEKSEDERQKALENIEKWGEYLEKGGVQPVLATCIGEDIPQHKDSVGESYVKEYNAAIKDMQQRHPTWSLIDFVKIDQPDIFRPNDGWHPGDTGYKRMGTKIEQCFSSAEK